jgi:hypothetical protein
MARDLHTCEQLINGMIKSGLTTKGVDPGQSGVTRFFRLPVGVNAKRKYIALLGQPAPVRCIEFHPECRYSMAAISKAYGIDLTPPPPRVAREAKAITDEEALEAAESFDALIQILRDQGMLLSDPDSAAPWIQITCPWVDTHSDRADTGAALAHPSKDNSMRGGFVCHHRCRGTLTTPPRNRGLVLDVRKLTRRDDQWYENAKTIDDVYDWVAKLPRKEVAAS